MMYFPADELNSLSNKNKLLYSEMQPVILILSLIVTSNCFSLFHHRGRTYGRLYAYPPPDLQEIDALIGTENSLRQKDFVSTLNSLKERGLVQKWNSTILDLRASITTTDVQLVSRTSFSSTDYFQDIVNGAVSSQKSDSFAAIFTIVSGFSVIFGSILVPQLALPDGFKNFIGIFCLVVPFALISINALFPGIYLDLQRAKSNSNTKSLDDRILYHEAGHFLAGYLCGVPVTSYDIRGDRDAGTTIELDIPNDPSASDPYKDAVTALKRKAGNLLVVSMSGMVAETLRFGDSKGGAEDFTFASTLLRILQIPNYDRDGCLRWAVMKALILLRIHRDSLDDLAEAMRHKRSISDCIRCIESAKSEEI